MVTSSKAISLILALGLLGILLAARALKTQPGSDRLQGQERVP